MASRAAELVAAIIDRLEGRPYRTGRPPLPTVDASKTIGYCWRNHYKATMLFICHIMVE